MVAVAAATASATIALMVVFLAATAHFFLLNNNNINNNNSKCYAPSPVLAILLRVLVECLYHLRYNFHRRGAMRLSVGWKLSEVDAQQETLSHSPNFPSLVTAHQAVTADFPSLHYCLCTAMRASLAPLQRQLRE